MFSNKEIPSVGGSIGIERIFELLEKKYKDSNSVRATET
jgi:histidyl-tRNA synthetase